MGQVSSTIIVIVVDMIGNTFLWSVDSHRISEAPSFIVISVPISLSTQLNRSTAIVFVHNQNIPESRSLITIFRTILWYVKNENGINPSKYSLRNRH